MLGKVNLRRKNTSDIFLKKSNVEWLIIWLVLFFSFINNSTLLISSVLLLFLLRQGEIGALKILNIITLRTIMNPSIAIDLGSIQNLKWLIIFTCSFYLILSIKKIEKTEIIRLKSILFPIIIFGTYSILASFFTSNLPIVATFKLISFLIPFLGVLIGVFLTGRKFDWLNWLYTMLLGILFFSIPFINHPIGYYRNQQSFQGITNQPNMFGITLVLLFSIILTRLQLKKINNKFLAYILLILIFYIGFLTNSRTSLISMFSLFIIYIFFLQMNLKRKIMLYNLIGIFSIVSLLLNRDIITKIMDFLYKGQENILSSRLNQIDNLTANFMRNPLFGSGFAVPFTPYRSYNFSTDYVVEPGNLIISVLSYVGIIGFIFFIIYMYIILKNNNSYQNTIFLFLAPIFISMGEMVFFSSNNIGIWCYMFLILGNSYRVDDYKMGRL